MGNGENISNLLIRDGLSQSQRNSSTPLTAGDTVKLDKRTTADMLDFIYRYARYVLYYDDQSDDDTLSPEGDWQGLFTGNLPFRYAIIHKFPIAQYQQKYFEVRNRQVLRATEVGLLVNRIFSVAAKLNAWHNALKVASDKATLFLMLDALIKTDLTKALYRLIEITNAIDQEEYDISALQTNSAWSLTFDKLIAVDKSLKRFDAYPRRKTHAVITALDEVFTLFYKGIEQVQKFAGEHFNDGLASGQEHPAHLGLLYSFLKLFERVTEGLNKISGKHLDFFYKEILQLKQREFVPDHVHVVIELAKQTSAFLLQKDTALNAGKLKNKNVDFLLENDIVANKAAVNSLRTLFKDEKGNIYIAPVANSADGTGTAFRDPAQNSWPVLGAKEYDDKNNPASGEDDKKHYPFGATGLIFASRVFLLKEGDRQIEIKITLDKDIEKLKSAIENPLNIIDEARFKLLEKAGLGKMFLSLIPAKREAGWSVLITDSHWDKMQIARNALDSAQKITSTFILDTFYTSDKGWMPFSEPVFEITTEVLTITFKLNNGAPAVVPPDLKELKVAYPVNDPLVRISFNHQARYHLANGIPYYDILSNCIIKDITIDVKVENAKELLLANDDGPVDGKKTFFPFTSIPKTGSNFYIGSDEAFRKKLTSFDLKVTWDGLPDNLDDYYLGYSLPPGVSMNNSSVEEELLENGTWATQISSLNLFTATNCSGDATKTCLLKSTDYPIPVPNNQPVISQDNQLLPYNNAALNGYIRFRLNSHFYHLQYPAVLAKKLLGVKDEINLLIDNSIAPIGITQQSTLLKAAAESADNHADQLVVGGSAADLAGMTVKTQDTLNKSIALDTDAQKLKNFLLPDDPGPVNIPLPPYTPVIKDISFNYTASAGAEDVTLLHLYPFEESNYKLLQAKDTRHFFPLFNDEGSLYIALGEATPGSNISILFQLAEFTANPDIQEAQIIWQYLCDNYWKPLLPVTDIIIDTTVGLQVSGIVTIALPWDANETHTILPSGKCWLKASAKKYTGAVCEAITVSAQGVKAVFGNQENDLSRLALPLTPGSIATTRLPKSEIKKITQDYPSFGGMEPEDENHFYMRVSERLRHKGRAISIFDYEHLVLEAFPSVFKVKCIPHTKMCLATAEGNLLSSPGWVTLAVIPEIKDYPASSRFEPKVSRIVLKNIKDFISSKTSAFVQVQVVNPRYQPVDFQGKIFLKKGKDIAFYTSRLKQDVSNFLSPWILTGSGDIIFGGTLMMSSALGFIEKLDYVEYVTDFEMLDIHAVPVKGITATLPWSVLTSGNQKYEVAVETGKA